MKEKKKKRKPVCGTQAGYAQHLRNRERPCSQCLIGCETYNNDEIWELIQEFHVWRNEQKLWKTYQLSLERFEQIFAEQGRRCACCASKKPGESAWHVDHDHQTGRIRGILCSNCNTGIAQLGDDLKGLQRALAYLQAHQTRGGHQTAQKPPAQQRPHPKISAVMQRCFELFKQAVPRDKVVVILRLAPRTVDEIHTLWTRNGGKINRASRHVFQIAKEPPQRFTCTCGYAAPWNTPDEMDTAVDRVNVHIKEANADHEAEWNRLAAEERNRRISEERRKKEEQQRLIAEELRQPSGSS